MAGYLLLCVCLGLTSYLCKAQAPDAGGDGSIWTSNDGAGHKIVAGISCERVLADDDMFKMTLIGYEIDQADDGTVKYFDYELAQALDRNMVDTMNMKVLAEPAESGACATYTAGGDNFHTFAVEVDETAADVDLPCGLVRDPANTGTVYKIAVRFSRYAGYDSQYDRVFLAECDAADPTQTLVTTLDGPMVQVGPVAKELLTRRYTVGMIAIQGDVTPDYSLPDVAITAAIDLGYPVRLRVCLGIGSALGDTRTMFDEDGLGVIGIKVTKCTAFRDVSQGIDGSDLDLVDEAVFLDASCSLDVPPAKTADGTASRFMWYKSQTDGDQAWRFSPNCWYFGPYEAVAFTGKNIGGTDRVTNVLCELEYCKSSADAACFGSQAGDGSDGANYDPVCTAKRKRRQADDVFGNLTDLLPKTVSTVITVRGEAAAQTDEDCFDTPTFYALTAVLAVLLVIVMAIAGFLALKLRSVMNDIDSHDSKVGIQNKAYY